MATQPTITGSSAKELYNEVDQNYLEYIYRGGFSQGITESILTLAETNFDESEGTTIRRRVYFIMVEGLQNITRHQDKTANKDVDKKSIFVVQNRNQRYYITTGNIIKNKHIDSLRNKLNKINQLDKKELKKYYKETLYSGDLSDKGGAGLGLIEMARKSGNKLHYRFKKVNEEVSFFYFRTEIPTNADSEKESIQHGEESIDKIVNLHSTLIQQNVIIKFKGVFHQDNLLNLLTLLENYMSESQTAIKLFNIMVEMLQNIIKHGDSHYSSLGNPGIFYINHLDNNFYITSANFVQNDKLDFFKKQINFVNSLDQEGLDNYYDKILLDFDTEDAKKTGLGLLDIRMKSQQKIAFEEYRIDNTISFFALQTYIPLTN